MSLRFTPLLAGVLVLTALAGCSGAGAAAPAASVPAATPAAVPEPTLVPAPPTERPAPTATPIVGGVDEGPGPVLSVEPVDDTTIAASIEDPVAKGWRLEVRGTGTRSDDAWMITAEVGDVGPVISATEIVAGKPVNEMDLSGLWDGTAAAGGCHATLGVCLGTDGFTVPMEGQDTFSVQLRLDDPTTPLEVKGAAAYWKGEPFVLGPWHETEAFPWEPAAG